jgi:RNA polymerase sigma-70 factor (ECF subfamily)
MDELRGGQSGADFDDFFYTVLPRVLRVGQRLTGNRHAAEDIAAEAFARAYARWRKVGELPYRDAWVLKVATNLAIDAARRRVAVAAIDEGTVVLDVADVVALRATLVSALAALSRSQREAVVLRYLVDLPEDQVAVALGIRPGTVKSHLHRAVAKLRQQIGSNQKDLGYDARTI